MGGEGEETMITVNQGMSVEEIERVVAQRVANAIEAIAIYETKTNMARKSISQTEQQECKLAENANNKRKYVGGLPDMIHGNIVASRPKIMQDAIEMATELMDKKISTLAKRQAENKRKLDNNNQAQQQSPKRQNVAQAYAARTGERKEYARTLPLNPAAARNQGTLTCYGCGNPGHYRSDCPELKNQNHGNQAEGIGARGMVYAFGGGETEQDINNIEDEIEA
ncbi:reverse transcriptase domain-containing protein [Tanacetum coccineum]|uniref:Reverse transcriptase domain-containing protein n=1 Tax=Tanacetum coccineum TaxID=301880 RepID=A0ABQ5GFY5_9ASTR